MSDELKETFIKLNEDIMKIEDRTTRELLATDYINVIDALIKDAENKISILQEDNA